MRDACNSTSFDIPRALELETLATKYSASNIIYQALVRNSYGAALWATSWSLTVHGRLLINMNP